jgi:hypothetical protein
MGFISFIDQLAVIKKILEHLGLRAGIPCPAGSRSAGKKDYF